MMRKYGVLICMLIAVFFLILATLLYPGGSMLNKSSEGFNWSENFFSNLFLEKALNGAVNPARIWALIGMIFHSVGYGLFFIHTARKILHKQAVFILQTIGIVNMLFIFLIATSWHDIMVTVSSTLTMLGLFYMTVFVFRTSRTWLKILCVGSMLLFYFTLFLYGTGNWTLLAIMQKIAFVSFLFLVLAIEYRTTVKDFQRASEE